MGGRYGSMISQDGCSLPLRVQSLQSGILGVDARLSRRPMGTRRWVAEWMPLAAGGCRGTEPGTDYAVGLLGNGNCAVVALRELLSGAIRVSSSKGSRQDFRVTNDYGTCPTLAAWPAGSPRGCTASCTPSPYL